MTPVYYKSFPLLASALPVRTFPYYPTVVYYVIRKGRVCIWSLIFFLERGGPGAVPVWWDNISSLDFDLEIKGTFRSCSKIEENYMLEMTF